MVTEFGNCKEIQNRIRIVQEEYNKECHTRSVTCVHTQGNRRGSRDSEALPKTFYWLNNSSSSRILLDLSTSHYIPPCLVLSFCHDKQFVQFQKFLTVPKSCGQGGNSSTKIQSIYRDPLRFPDHSTFMCPSFSTPFLQMGMVCSGELCNENCGILLLIVNRLSVC